MRVFVKAGAALVRRSGTAAALSIVAIALSGCLDLKPPTACSVTIAPGTISVPVNGAVQVVGTAFDCKGNSIPATKKTVSFSSSNTTVVTVTPGGSVIGVSVGTATVSAVADGKTGTAAVTVTPEVATTVAVTPASVTLRKTNVRTFTAVARNAQGTVITGRTFRWNSSNSAIASVDQNGQVIAQTAGNVNITAELDQSTGTSQVVVTELPVGSCSLAPLSQKITVGQQAQPVITLRDTANALLSAVGRAVAWTSSNEIVASVTSNTGVVSARKSGTARVTASPVDNSSVSCFSDFEVVDPRIAQAIITPRSGQLRVGVPRQFTVQLLDSVGGPIPPGRVVNWRNPTPTIATISPAGLVTGIALGNAKIAVDAEGAVDTVILAVTKIPVGTVAVSPLQSSILQGGTVQLTPTVTDSAGVIVTDRLVEWQSSNLGLAIVSTNGLVTGLAPGSVTIAATSETKSGLASVNVSQIPVDSIATEPTFTTVKNSQNALFAIRLLDAQGNQLFNRVVNISSSQPSVAIGVANATANVVAVSVFGTGETTLTLRAQNANGQPEGKITRVTVTVTLPPNTP